MSILADPPEPQVSKKSTTTRATAESMAAKQRDISVSEFFAKNRHLLGFDNPRKALLTTVKEAVDNSLDACEEGGILPDITVVIEDLQPDRPATAKSSRYRITAVDNGPGIVKNQVEHIFGRLLYGSKFHRLKMSRGQQGIGISAAGMYGLITTGKPMLIQTRPKANKPAHHMELAINTKTNRAEVTIDVETDDFPLKRLRALSPSIREQAEKGELLNAAQYPTGTSVSIELEGKYQRGRGSVDEFLELTAIANPHAKITFIRPTRTTEEEQEFLPSRRGSAGKPAAESTAVPQNPGTAVPGFATPDASTPATPATTQDLGDFIVFPRAVNELPPETKEIQPHPRGVELGTLIQMLKDYEASMKGGTLYNFLQERFSRVSSATAKDFCEKISTTKNRVTSHTKVANVEPAQAEALYKVFQDAKLAPPPTDCLAPIGVQQLLKGMFKGVRAEFYAASSREPDVYRGRPFLIETAIAFGGELPADDSCRVIRFANRVPLLFQQSACSSFKAVIETNWRNYDLQQPRGAVPVGPLVIMIHMASVWVPFTSESKEAVADYDEIRKEMKLALMECGRKLGTYLNKRHKMQRESDRRDVFQKYIGEIAKAASAITGTDAQRLYEALLKRATKHTAVADVELDEEGKIVKKGGAPEQEDGVLIVDPSSPGPTLPRTPAGETALRGGLGGTGGGGRVREAGGGAGSIDNAPPMKLSKSEAAALKVHAMAKGIDDQPQLIDTDSPKRLTQKGKAPPAPKPAAKKGSTAKAGTVPKAESPQKPAAKPSPTPTPTPTPVVALSAKKPKPKMRLVNGKLVPVDEPGLF